LNPLHKGKDMKRMVIGPEAMKIKLASPTDKPPMLIAE